MKPEILKDEEIRTTLKRANREAQLYGDDGEPLPEKALVILTYKKTLEMVMLIIEKQIWRSIYITPDNKQRVITGIRHSLQSQLEEIK